MSATASPAARPGPSRRVWVLSVVAVALVGVSPALRSGHVVGDGVDLFGTIWFYWWVEHCLTALADPGWTPHFFFPLGKDIFAHTGNNLLDALFSVPFQWVFGAPAYQKWVVFAILLLNAATFRVLAAGLMRSGWAVFAATLAWELNPYVLFELTAGRPTQAFLPFLPLGIHYFLACSRTEGADATKAAGWCGLATALQAWTYWFMGWFMAFLFAWLALHELWRHPQRRRLLARYAVAGLTCGVVVAPAALAMAGLAADGLVPGLADGGRDLFTAPQELSNNVAATLHGYVLMETVGPPMYSYLTWALPLLAYVAVGRQRSRWLPGLALVLLWSIGPVLPLGPGRGTMVLPTYMAAYHYLPFFDRLWFPYRMLSVAMCITAVMFGLLVDRLLAWRPALGRHALVGILGWGALTGLEQHRFDIYPFVTRDLTPPITMSWIREERGAVLHLPFGVTHRSIVWQTFHEQPMFGGMGENAPLLWPEGFRDRLRNSFVRTLVRLTRNPVGATTYHPAQRQRLEAEGFRWIVLHRDLVELELPRWTPGRTMEPEKRIAGARQVTERLVETLGPPSAVEAEMVTWDLTGTATPPERISYTPERLAERTWDTDQMSEYERALRDEGRIREGPAPGMGNAPNK